VNPDTDLAADNLGGEDTNTIDLIEEISIDGMCGVY
jgi:mycofactocin precursor